LEADICLLDKRLAELVGADPRRYHLLIFHACRPDTRLYAPRLVA
jgi:hypothetical protein